MCSVSTYASTHDNTTIAPQHGICISTHYEYHDHEVENINIPRELSPFMETPDITPSGTGYVPISAHLSAEIYDYPASGGTQMLSHLCLEGEVLGSGDLGVWKLSPFARARVRLQYPRPQLRSPIDPEMVPNWRPLEA